MLTTKSVIAIAKTASLKYATDWTSRSYSRALSGWRSAEGSEVVR